MKVLIIEDEAPAAEKLERYLHKYDPSIEIMGVIDNAALQGLLAQQPERATAVGCGTVHGTVPVQFGR